MASQQQLKWLAKPMKKQIVASGAGGAVLICYSH